MLRRWGSRRRGKQWATSAFQICVNYGRLANAIATALCSVPNRQFSGSLLRMRLLEPGDVTLFDSLFKSLQVGCSRRILELFSRALLFEILLSRHVQVRFRRQRCAARRLFSGLLTEFISSTFFRRCAASRAMSVEYRHATHDERRQSDEYSETHRFELSGHNSL